MLDKQTIAVVAASVGILAPVVLISLAMTSESPRRRRVGYYALSGLCFLFFAGCFALGVTGENRGGFLWMTVAAYCAYWAWRKAANQKA